LSLVGDSWFQNRNVHFMPVAVLTESGRK